MAVIGDAVKMWSRSEGSHSTEDLLERKARFRDGWTVLHDPGTSMGDILNAPQLPKLGDIFETSPWIFCKSRNPKRGLVYTTVDVEYEGEIGPGEGTEGSPLDDLPKYNFSSVTSEEAIDEAAYDDGAGIAIATKLGEPIEGVTKPVHDILLTVDRNFIDVNLPATQQYLDSVNSDAWPPIKPFPPGRGNLRNFKAEPILQPNGVIKYWTVHAEVLFRTPYRTTDVKAWHARVRHEGYRHKADNDAIANAWDDLQMNVNKPVLLDADGKKLPPNADAVWLEFPIFTNKLPYSALGLF